MFQGSRKSYIFEERSLELRPTLPKVFSGKGRNKGKEGKGGKGGKERQELLYLLLVESIFSNWHYITYLVLIVVHLQNFGLLTLPLPLVVFCFGIVSSERAGKQVWRALLVLVMLPVLFKFGVGTGLLEYSSKLRFLLAGQDLDSSIIEYFAIVCIVGECVVLKLTGLWEESTQEIECMRMALVRNLVNSQEKDDREELREMLRRSEDIPGTFA